MPSICCSGRTYRRLSDLQERLEALVDEGVLEVERAFDQIFASLRAERARSERLQALGLQAPLELAATELQNSLADLEKAAMELEPLEQGE